MQADDPLASIEDNTRPGTHVIGAKPDRDAQKMLPTRIITYAWGKKYITELLTLTLPAVLAPGNLPYVASVTDCEVVILTEESAFAEILASPVVARIQELCPLRLMSLDDFITTPDQYGIALTYTLHRGFADLGPSVTDTWLLFLNADFVLADGSWRHLLARLSAGERLVASPSYCVRTHDAVPKLLEQLDAATSVLALPPREMASLALKHRHNTIRGKTINQSSFSLRYMDQFYWLVDDHTLIGHQMPIAIVGMRPERYVREPITYWDYGLIWEFCPQAAACVLGDSDEFLMLELRESEVAKDQIIPGWPTPKEIGELMVTWVTSYQRDFARHPLTLHSREIPPVAGEARTKLRAFVDEVLSHAAELPPHTNHPQWEHHRPRFFINRQRYLAPRLGELAGCEAPPAWLFADDEPWWQLERLERRHALHRREQLGVMEIALRVAQEGPASHDDATDRFAAELHRFQAELNIDAASRQCPAPPATSRDAEIAEPEIVYSDISRRYDEEFREVWKRIASSKGSQRELPLLLKEHYEAQLGILDAKFEQARAPLVVEYRRRFPILTTMTPPGVTEMMPEPKPEPEPALPQSPPRRWRLQFPAIAMTIRLYRRLTGSVPHVSRLHPYWGVLRYLVHIVETAAAKGRQNVLSVAGPDAAITRTVADHLPGHHARISIADLLAGAISERDREQLYDLCICEVGFSELHNVGSVLGAAELLMKPGGTIVAFSMNRDEESNLSGEWLTELLAQRSVEVRCAGSASLVRAMRQFDDLDRRLAGRALDIAKACLLLPLAMYRALSANRAELRDEGFRPEASVPSASVTLTYRVGSNAHGASLRQKTEALQAAEQELEENRRKILDMQHIFAEYQLRFEHAQEASLHQKKTAAEQELEEGRRKILDLQHICAEYQLRFERGLNYQEIV